MFVVLWTSPDQSLCTRDHVPDGVLRHCHHCRPSPRRPSCSPCCPRSSSHAVGVAVCQTPPASPTVTFTTLPPSPRATTAQPSRPTSPCSIGDARTHKLRSRAGSNARPEVSLSREHDAISITVAVAAATLEPAAFVLGEPAHEYHHAPRASHERQGHHSHRLRDDCVPLHPGCDAPRHLRAAAEFRCCRGLLDCASHNPRPVPVVHSRL